MTRSIPKLLIPLAILFLLGCNNSERRESLYSEIYGSKLESMAAKAKDFVGSKNMNPDFCILVDMEIHSGLKRFFVWDFNQNKVRHSFLVSHGCGESPWGSDKSKTEPKFSNTDGSHLSSLGKYQIGERGYSSWGVHKKYLLHGLESTNSNSLKRVIVLHSWDSITDNEIYPSGTVEGWGCPAISNNSFLTLDPMLKSARKPTLLWIYN